MEEKELVKRVKNSLKAKKSDAQILKGFQNKGYTLEYGEEILTKAKRPKRVFLSLLIAAVLIISLTFSGYTFLSSKEKMQLENPYNVDGVTASSAGYSNGTVEITSEFVTYLLNELGAWKLHPNVVTLQKPVIKTVVSNQEFYSVVSSSKIVTDSKVRDADIEVTASPDTVIFVISSDNPEVAVTSSIETGDISIVVLASEAELLAKGYLALYEELQ